MCDTMSDDVLHKYDAYPERIVVIQNGIVLHDGGEMDIYGMQFDISGVLSWLRERVQDARAQGTAPSTGSSSDRNVTENSSSCRS